ncbi:MAG: RnfABCDGE type electron transport complex subunit G [Mariprofundus sp.]
MNIDREQVHMVIALFLVAAIAAVLLGLTDIVTREPIAAAQKKALHTALQQVLPEHANDPQLDVITIGAADSAVQVYPAKAANGDVLGLAWEVVAPDGYSGSIRILVGLKRDGHIHAIRVISHKETPGLGDGIVKNNSWLGSFVQQGLDSKIWKVKKDGGDFDQFTGATITPRAVVKAVKGALEFFHAHQQDMLARFEAAAKAPLAEPMDNTKTGGNP